MYYRYKYIDMYSYLNIHIHVYLSSVCAIDPLSEPMSLARSLAFRDLCLCGTSFAFFFFCRISESVCIAGGASFWKPQSCL